MILLACSILLQITSAITWENTGELQSALYVYDITVGSGGYIYAGTKIDNGGSLDCGRVFYSQDMWNWQLCDSVPWVSPDDQIEGVYALFNGVGDTLFAGTGVYHSGDVPRIHKSSDGGATWSPLNSYGTYRVGSRVCALLEDNLGTLHLGNNYWGMSAAYPRYSTDRGNTWELLSSIVFFNRQTIPSTLAPGVIISTVQLITVSRGRQRHHQSISAIHIQSLKSVMILFLLGQMQISAGYS